MTGLRLISVLATCVTLTSGCASTTTTPIDPTPRCILGAVAAPIGPAAVSTVIEAPLNSVIITDVTITNKVMVQGTNARRNQTGTVAVWARLVNCVDFPLQLEARTHFLDEASAPAEPASAWTRLMLSPRSYVVYSESSTGIAEVRNYYVEIREGR